MGGRGSIIHGKMGVLVGIAGGTGSGKTSFARKVGARLGPERCVDAGPGRLLQGRQHPRRRRREPRSTTTTPTPSTRRCWFRTCATFERDGRRPTSPTTTRPTRGRSSPIPFSPGPSSCSRASWSSPRSPCGGSWTSSSSSTRTRTCASCDGSGATRRSEGGASSRSRASTSRRCAPCTWSSWSPPSATRTSSCRKGAENEVALEAVVARVNAMLRA